MASPLVSAQGVLIDSDVLIWLMRGNAAALAAVNLETDWYVSAVSYMELVQGCRNKAELKAIQKAFKSGASDVLPVTQSISESACRLVEKYSLSHSVHLADALIAATAMEQKLPLLSGNGKHFAAIDGLELRTFKP
jgi:hypothetical protein